MRHFAFAAPRTIADARPFDTINTTPLIDVLLVLLIMFIITIPMQTHKVAIELPAAGGAGALPVTHALMLSRAGALTLDGAPVTDATLPARLQPIIREPGALLTMRTDPEARYERFDQTLAIVKRAGVQRLAFVGNGEMVER